MESENIQLTVLFEIFFLVQYNVQGRMQKTKKTNFSASLLVSITEAHTFYFMYIAQTTATAE